MTGYMERAAGISLAALTLMTPVAVAQQALTSAFTYQGRLKKDQSLRDDPCDFEFSLWDAKTGGFQVGPTLTFNGLGDNPDPVKVEKGLFTVELDFDDPSIFDGTELWLEIWVGCDEAMQMLTDRQKITAAPEAVHAARPWLLDENNDIRYIAGRVGIGWTPEYHLDVRGSSPALRIWGVNGGADETRVLFREGTGGTGHTGVDLKYDGVNDNFVVEGIVNDVSQGEHFIVERDSGRVGLGGAIPDSGTLEINQVTDTPHGGITLRNANSQALRLWVDDQDRRRIDGGSAPSYPVIINGGSTGKVGIGVEDPQARLHVGGNLEVDGDLTVDGMPCTCSDARFKTNVEPIRDALAMIGALDGVRYDWRADEFPDRGFDDRRHVGVIAQDVLPILPEIVRQDTHGKYAVAYDGLVPVLIEAVKELHAEGAVKDQRLVAAEQELIDVRGRLARLESLLVAQQEADR